MNFWLATILRLIGICLCLIAMFQFNDGYFPSRQTNLLWMSIDMAIILWLAVSTIQGIRHWRRPKQDNRPPLPTRPPYRRKP